MRHKKLRALVIAGGLLASGTLFSAGAHAEMATPAMLSNTCAGCHGPNGVSPGPAMPSIAGMPAPYLTMMLQEFASGERHSTIMGRIAKGYSNEQIAAIAGFISQQDWGTGESASVHGTAVDNALVDQGESLAGKCNRCHGDDGVPEADDDESPRLAGQWLDYLLIKMDDYQNVEGIRQPRKMRRQIEALSADQLRAIAHYYAGQ